MSDYKPEDFKKVYLHSGKIQYEHVENGNKRLQIVKDVQSGVMSKEEFAKEQKKMRGGKYLKFLFSESQYHRAISQTKGEIK